jgi:hypothetical protein
LTVHEKFVKDMEVAGINTAAYRGLFFWNGTVQPPVPINKMGQHLRTSSGKPQFLFRGTLWIQLTSCTRLAKLGQDGRMAGPIQQAKKLKRTVTGMPTLQKPPKLVTKKTKNEN